jgi:hypothetical protein
LGRHRTATRNSAAKKNAPPALSGTRAYRMSRAARARATAATNAAPSVEATRTADSCRYRASFRLWRVFQSVQIVQPSAAAVQMAKMRYATICRSVVPWVVLAESRIASRKVCGRGSETWWISSRSTSSSRGTVAAPSSTTPMAVRHWSDSLVTPHPSAAVRRTHRPTELLSAPATIAATARR